MTTPIPAVKTVASIQFTEPEVYTLDNGLEVFGFNGAGNDVIKVDLIFSSGRWTENKPLVSAFCSDLLKSGTKDQSAFDLAERIDFLGGTLKSSAGYNSFTLSLYCLTRHLEACLQILLPVLNDTIFPENEIVLTQQKRLSKLKINQLKNDYVGDMAFKEMLFGPNHPYGYVTTADMIKSIDQNDIIEYYYHQLNPSLCYVGLAGKYGTAEIDLLNKYLGNKDNWQKGLAETVPNWEIESSQKQKRYIELPDSVQASIYIGNRTIERSHIDYIPFALLNMVFGGYFGSRLMSNLREDKGLTYGVYSYNQNYKYGAAFIINTETALKHLKTCLKEIYFEMDRLKDQLIPEDELLMAGNYLLGRLLDQVDGPFKLSNTFMSLKGHGLSLDYFKQMEKTIKSINPEQLLETAQKYFIKENMFEVVVK
ncbi:MAG: pitrilysin family protein [Chitinophagales bacterium]